MLRVGTVAPGETPPSNTAINREEDEPPRINKQMRQAKLNLAVDLTINLHSFSEPQMEDLFAVSNWVLKYCDKHSEPLQFQYSNGQNGVRSCRDGSPSKSRGGTKIKSPSRGLGGMVLIHCR